jgi:CxC2 like cysteine cluster associated with KDZ transposases
LLAPIEEYEETPEVERQLLTPRQTPQPETPQPECLEHIPVPSDSLFDHAEASPESEDSAPNRTYTAPSGNPMLIVVDRNGVFDQEILFCVCTNNHNRDEQLLENGLFPATFKSIKTVFTFAVLDDFLQDNLECKTTAQQYYSKLQNMTNKMFPNLVPACSTLFSFISGTNSQTRHRIYINSF